MHWAHPGLGLWLVRMGEKGSWSLPGHFSHVNKVPGLFSGSFLTINCQKTRDQKGNGMSIPFYYLHPKPRNPAMAAF